MLELLDRYHGQATGIFTCDEHLAGKSPAQGTELCTVVEAMYSLEVLASILGDYRLGDRLEQLAFNALPATFKKDMTAHQYDQQANQVVCSAAGDHPYVNNRGDSNLYGLEPNFGCCTANLHQGWPKFAAHLWMKTSDGGLAVVAYAPCVVTTTIQGKPVRVTVETAYPFRDEIVVSVTVPEAMKFPVYIRIPEWTERYELLIKGSDSFLRDGQRGSLELTQDLSKREANEREYYLPIKGEWHDTKAFTLRLRMSVHLYHGYNNSVAIERGPLVYSLPVDAEWRKVKDNAQFADWEVYPKSPWNYALQIDRDHPERSMTFDDRTVGATPFSVAGAPVVLRVKGKRLRGWGLEKGAAAPPPQSPVSSQSPLEELTLVPYGCTDLRVTEFPTLGGR